MTVIKRGRPGAEAESKALQGQGVANQRKAIIEGLKQSVEAFSDVVEGTTPRDVMMLVLVTQYLDTMKEIGTRDKSNTVFVSHSPAAIGSLFEGMQYAVMVGQKAAAASAYSSRTGCDRLDWLAAVIQRKSGRCSTAGYAPSLAFTGCSGWPEGDPRPAGAGIVAGG